MAGSTVDDYGAGDGPLVDGTSSLQSYQSVESLAEWRSCDQVENGTPSTSPPYWDTYDDDDCGPKPSDLYGKFTWKIENFSQITKRELRSNEFEVGGYKWYILVYPQGCDVCNHLSLFLCVANHDKLLPGWSHFAQFTISVVNKDPRHNKYSDTLHRFWKKEHDWGWKKFMELSKMLEGFVDDDTLTIKAQVQVIREKVLRPFHCLDCQYRREILGVYVANVEQTCRRFVDERRAKFIKLIDDKVKWTSFRAFWFGIDQNARRYMSREKSESILKVVVKQFFLEKEVISTLVMDSLYTGLRALECQSKKMKGREMLVERDDFPAPMVYLDKDIFVLAEDVFLLIERVAVEPLPHQPLPTKDDKYLQSRTKDGGMGDKLSRDFILREERRLTELGRRTLEIFILAHIFSSRIEVAYQEAVALKRQEELIREEEAAEQAENELKAKRSASLKEKKAKKKQAKQRRSNRKSKDREKGEKSDGVLNGKHQQLGTPDERVLEDFSLEKAHPVHEKVDSREDVSDVSDPGDDGAEALQPDLEDRDAIPLSWDTDTSEIHLSSEVSIIDAQNVQMEKRSPSIMDDSSSTCSTDSVPSIVVNGPYKGNSAPNAKSNNTPSIRGKNQRNKDTRAGSTFDSSRLIDASCSWRGTRHEVESGIPSLIDQMQWPDQRGIEKEEDAAVQKKFVEDRTDVDTFDCPSTTEQSSNPASTGRKPPTVKHSCEDTTTNAAELVSTQEPRPDTPTKSENSAPLLTKSPQIPQQSEAAKHDIPPKTIPPRDTSSVSRPCSAPLIPTASLVTTARTAPLLSRTFSSVTRAGAETSSSGQISEPQSYRNVAMGIKSTTSTILAASNSKPSLNPTSQSDAFSQPSSSSTSSSSARFPHISARIEQGSIIPGFTFGSVSPESLCSMQLWTDDSHHQLNGNTRIQNSGESAVSLCQSQRVMQDEFPHLDIINALLDEDQQVGRAIPDYHYNDDYLNWQYGFPRNDNGLLSGSCEFEQPDYYYDDIPLSAYRSSGVPFDALRDPDPMHLYLSAYCDAMHANQWSIGNADLSVLNLRNAMDASGYHYQPHDYLTCGVGYNMMYGPANGH